MFFGAFFFYSISRAETFRDVHTPCAAVPHGPEALKGILRVFENTFHGFQKNTPKKNAHSLKKNT